MSEETKPNNPLDPEIIADAEILIGLEFTNSERQQMLDLSFERIGNYKDIRGVKIENDVSLPLIFDPRLPAAKSPLINRSRQIVYSPTQTIRCPTNLEEAAFYTVRELGALIRTRQVTVLALTEMYLGRLERLNRHLECVVSFTKERAIEQAKQADAEIAAGKYRGPLHGIPWGAKDLLAVKGYKTTWGAMPYKDQTLDMDATVVQRLDEAGAILIAKLTLGALAYGDIWFDGRTNNPWNLEEGSSGSSAGSASAVAAGLVGFALGTETLGSIVSPATRCGVTGLRPTFGRVSRHGAMALSWSMDKIGPLARDVEDCALVLEAIYGPDGHDPYVINEAFHWQPDFGPKTLRVGYYKSAFDEERENKANDDAVLDVMLSLGFDLKPIELPASMVDPLFIILVAEGAAAFDELTRHNLDDELKWQDPEAWPNTFRQARFIPAVEYIQANRIRMQLMHQMAAVMQDVDVFITPSFGGKVLQITNLTGHPTVVVPNGFNDKNSPTSISFVGNLFKEVETLAVAREYQNATDFHRQYPSLEFDV